MIIFILLVLVLIGCKFLEKYDDCLSLVLAVFFTVFIALSTFIIILSHMVAPKEIHENAIKYESLCKRLEIINSDYEDVSKSDVIADIAEWNSFVYNTKYWTYNPWTNWYNPKEIADNLEYISIE